LHVRVFLRNLAVFAGAFLLAHGLRLLPSNTALSSGLLILGLGSFLGGLSYTSAEENMLSHVLAAYIAAILLAGVILFFLSP
jgi:hypothetical protein